jgi:glucose-1-phosphate cytidylyltransferase
MNNLVAIILCGGKGVRLRPLTNDTPKPLIHIDNKPILSHVIKHLRSHGIKKFVIATGYQSNKIKEFMEETYVDLDYKLVDSGDTGILARVKDCIKGINSDFLLCYGDTISDINLTDLVKFHRKNSESVTISSFPIMIPFGVMEVDENNNVKSFNEKPILQNVMNIGYYYFNKEDYGMIDRNNGIIELLNLLIKSQSLKCYKHNGIHITINTLAELEIANENIKKIFK